MKSTAMTVYTFIFMVIKMAQKYDIIHLVTLYVCIDKGRSCSKVV